MLPFSVPGTGALRDGIVMNPSKAIKYSSGEMDSQ